jgi:hypothetical protein
VAWGMLYMQRCSRTQLRQSRAAAASEAAAAAVQGHHVIGTPTMFSRLAAAQQWVSSRLSWRSSNHGSTSSSSSDDCSSRTGGMVTAAAAADASSIPEPLTATTTTNSSSKGGDSGGEAGRPQHSLPCAVWAAVAPHVDAAQLLLVQGLAQAMAPEDCEWLGLPANTLLQYERQVRGVWRVLGASSALHCGNCGASSNLSCVGPRNVLRTLDSSMSSCLHVAVEVAPHDSAVPNMC